MVARALFCTDLSMLRKKWVLILGGLLVVLLVASFLGWSATKKGPPPFLKGISQNGYDDFVKAGNLLIGNIEDADSEAFMRTNQPALNAFREGLRQPFEAPAETYDLQTLASLIMPNLAVLKRLGQTIKAEGKLAEDSG